MSFINIHSHTDFPEKDVTTIRNIFPGDDFVVDLSKNCYFSIGLHPWNIKADTLISDIEIVKNFAENPNCLAVGETGLDRIIKIQVEIQKEVYLKHLEIARELSKPVIIHCVRAFSEIIQLHQPFAGKVKLIFHGFNNNWQIANELLEKECFLSFGKALLNPASNAAKIFSNIPENQLFLETDDAEISISEVYHKAALLKNISEDAMKEIVLRNFENCFGKKL